MTITVKVRRPSFSRYRWMARAIAGKSLFRGLQYERFLGLRLSGLVLDFGGGSRTNYTAYVPDWGDPEKGFTYQSVNIDPKTQPTYLIAPGAPLPVAETSIDHVISLNTFEHVYGVSGVFREIRRVLKDGGKLTFIVPFMFRVHGHPDDYLRGTPSFWVRLLEEEGFSDIRVEALTWGPFSTAQSVSGLPGPFKSLRRHAGLLLDLLYALLKGAAGKEVTAVQDDPVCAAPLGYCVEAVRCR